jgi:hypothetical protein
MVTAVSLRGIESRGDEMGEEREAFFDFGGKHLNGGMGASAPIITSKEFTRKKIYFTPLSPRRTQTAEVQ